MEYNCIRFISRDTTLRHETRKTADAGLLSFCSGAVDALAAARDAAQSEQIARLASALGKSVCHDRVSICDEGIVLTSLALCVAPHCSLPRAVGMIEADLINRLLSSGGFRAPREAGPASRAKNTKDILQKNVLDGCLGAVVWAAVGGYPFAYGKREEQ
eukprot:3160679-Pyramimonas_sp.AAC.1